MLNVEKKFSGNGFGWWAGKGMFAPIIQFRQATFIDRKRVLPGPAKILVRKGQTVAPDDPVAEDLISKKHLLLDIGRGLGMAPKRVDEFVHPKTGAAVAAGDILAGPVGLTRRVVRAPQGGKVVFTGQGKLLLELTGSPVYLKAGISGEVADLIPDRGVILRTYGALVQGVWGNGTIGQGDIHVMLDEPDEELTPRAIDGLFGDSIVVSGYCCDPTIFRIAAEKSVNGILLASMHPSLADLARQAKIPVILVEGFGRHPINTVAREILTGHDGHPAVINAEPWDALAGSRPELVIPHTAYQDPSGPLSIDFFAPGKKVRIVGVSQLGQVGTLLDLIGEVTYPNGVQAASARIQLDDEHTLDVPLANLELLV
jgi:hypothetical protein